MDWDQLWLGLGLGIPATGIALLGLRQSKKKDTDALRSGLLSNHREGTGQVIGGYSGLVDQLQEENKDLRAQRDTAAAERDSYWLELIRMRRKYGENGDTPQPPNKG